MLNAQLDEKHCPRRMRSQSDFSGWLHKYANTIDEETRLLMYRG